MATCARCGAEVLWKRLDGMPFAVDSHERTDGDERYVERDGLLLRVVGASEVSAYVAHRTTCPNPRR